MHFLKPASYVKIVPAYLPAPRLLVYISGIAEIVGGVGLLVLPVRRFAAWGLVLLLMAIFPANVNMALHSIQVTIKPVPQWLLWARLPLQAVLIGWVLWTSKVRRAVTARQ